MKTQEEQKFWVEIPSKLINNFFNKLSFPQLLLFMRVIHFSDFILLFKLSILHLIKLLFPSFKHQITKMIEMLDSPSFLVIKTDLESKWCSENVKVCKVCRCFC